MEVLADLYDAINSIEVNTVGSIYKLILSMLLGAVVGYERRRKGQTAGVRTFSLISMGATLAMLLSIYVPQEYMGLKNGDPGRIAAQVITGIGFLGAGAIIQMKGSVRGLTTAAGIWMMAIIGMAVGLGMYLLSIFASALILFILVQLERIEKRVSRGAESRIIRISLGTILHDIAEYRKVLKRHNIHLSNFYVDYDFEANETRLNLIVLVRETTNYIDLFSQFAKLYPTKAISQPTQHIADGRTRTHFRPRFHTAPRSSGDCPVQMDKTARGAWLHRGRIFGESSLRVPALCHNGGQYRLLGPDRHRGAAVLARPRVQLQKAHKLRRLSRGDSTDNSHRNDVRGLRHRPFARFQQYQQPLSRRNALDVVDNHHHQGIYRHGSAAEKVRLPRFGRAHCGRPLRRAYDGAAFVDSHQQQR